MQAFFVKNVNFFRFKVAALQTFILSHKYIYEQTFLKLPAALQTFIVGQINLQTFLKLREGYHLE